MFGACEEIVEGGGHGFCWCFYGRVARWVRSFQFSVGSFQIRSEEEKGRESSTDCTDWSRLFKRKKKRGRSVSYGRDARTT